MARGAIVKQQRDWAEHLGLALYVDKSTGQFWVQLLHGPAKKVALMPENRMLVKDYVENFAGKPIEQLDASAKVSWAILENLL